MESTKGLIQITGVYRNGETFLDNKRCPFEAKLGPAFSGAVTIQITLAVPTQAAGSILAGLASGADLSLDNVPTLLEQS